MVRDRQGRAEGARQSGKSLTISNHAQQCIHENKGLLRPLDESVTGATKTGRSTTREQPIVPWQLVDPQCLQTFQTAST